MSSSNKESTTSSHKSYYSTHINPDLINRATLKLLDENIEKMLKYIYDKKNEKSIFGHPEARIGLSLKLLHGTSIRLDKPVLDPIMEDIHMLIESEEYLQASGNPEKRLKCLKEELKFVCNYLDLDDTISLNTLYTYRKQQDKKTISDDHDDRKESSSFFFQPKQRTLNSQQPPDNGCNIM